MERSNLADVRVLVDDSLIRGLQVQLSSVSAVWLTGCWPPSRYVVASGVLILPGGRVTAIGAGLHLDLEISQIYLQFKNLRVEVSCPGGIFTVDGFGDGAERSGPLTSASVITEEGGHVTGIRCKGGWNVLCKAVEKYVSAEVVRSQLPEVAVQIINHLRGLQIGPGCNSSVNTFPLLQYSEKDCCEARYQTDHSGCLVGGQFNGRFVPGQTWAEGVECKFNKDTRYFQASCEAVPGSYAEKSPGVCTEVEKKYVPRHDTMSDWNLLHGMLFHSLQHLMFLEPWLVMSTLAVPVLLVSAVPLVVSHTPVNYRSVSAEEFVPSLQDPE